MTGFTRRLFLRNTAAAGAATVAAPAIAEAEAAPLDPYEQVKRDAEALAASMAALHGGTWWILIDHNCKVAAASRHFGNVSSEVPTNPVTSCRITSEDGVHNDFKVSS